MRKPFYRKQTQCWYAWLGGKQVRLGDKDAPKNEVLKLYYSLMAGAEPTTPDRGLTVQKVIGHFLEFSNQEQRTNLSVVRALLHFVRPVRWGQAQYQGLEADSCHRLASTSPVNLEVRQQP